MPSPNKPVRPTPFEAPQAPAKQHADAHAAPRDRNARSPWVAIALAVIVLLAVAVFTWLPRQISAPDTSGTPAPVAPSPTPQTATEPAAATPPAAGEAADAADTGAAPWEESLRAKMRQQAQAVLEPLLDRQFELEEMSVSQWAPREFSAALALASAGDELYRKREFDAATTQYREALAALDALLASVPERLQERLAAAGAALEELDQASALAALDTADLLAPGNSEAAALRERAALQPALVEAFSAAAAEEAAGKLSAARGHFAAAMEIDPDHQRAASEWQRISDAYRAQQYQDAMSRGYVALADNRLAEARAAFRAATALRPDAQEAQDALAQAGTAGTGARLAELQREGRRFEQAEQWQRAVATYREALQLDSAVLFAGDGLARSQPRAAMDKQLRELAAAPVRLSNPAVARETAQLLDRAKAVSPRGPTLAAQITEVERALELANTPVSVTLRSDAQTEVTVYKVARLGRFEQRELQLRPGTYTAVGNRVGYRDVRERFTIEPGAQSLTVTIACTEAI